MAVAQGLFYSCTKELADIFEDSDNDKTFYGFSDEETNDCEMSENEDWDELDLPEEISIKQESTSEVTQSFKLRVALRSALFHHPSSDDDDDNVAKGVKKINGANKKPSATKNDKHVKFQEEKKVVARLSPLKGDVSNSPEEESFLVKREQNIKANKAMLAQLMADLQNMPGAAGLLQKQTKQSKKKSSHTPRSGGDKRKNPERASRRLTRSMKGGDENAKPQEEELELTLEEALLEVRGASQRRGTPRTNQAKPHNVRRVEDITEEELELVADNMTEKIYNRVTGSTCHQCRQKTIDTKTCCRHEGCRGIQGQFCGPCLRNRYGEDVKKALLNPEWHCPPCRGICNCSFCRQREGRCPTGILFPLAQFHGFSDVHSYLTSLRNKINKEDFDD